MRLTALRSCTLATLLTLAGCAGDGEEGGPPESARQPVVYNNGAWRSGRMLASELAACAANGAATPYVLDHFWGTTDGFACHNPSDNTLSLFSTGWKGTSFFSEPAAPFVIADFNHDGVPDVLMRRSGGTNGQIVIAYAVPNPFSESVTEYFPASSRQTLAMPFACPASSGRMLGGDFDGDGWADLLCYDTATSAIKVAYGAAPGGLANATVVNTPSSNFSCPLDSDLVTARGLSTWTGLVCRRPNGTVDFGFPQRSGIPWVLASWTLSGACPKASGRFALADFNGDGRDDILCHDAGTAYTKIFPAWNGPAPFSTASDYVWEGPAGSFCPSSAGRLVVGSLNNANGFLPGGRRATLLCLESTSGYESHRQSDLVLPPTEFIVKSVGSTSVTLQFRDRSPDETSFVIRNANTRQEIASVGSFPGTGSLVTPTISGLARNTYYCFDAKSRNAFGDSTPTDGWCATTNP